MFQLKALAELERLALEVVSCCRAALEQATEDLDFLRLERDGEERLLGENQSTSIPLGCKHRLSNPGKIPVEMIEVQSGECLGEDDIVRFELAMYAVM